MPRRNLRWLIAITAISIVCYAYVPASRYSRVLARSLDLVASQYYRPVNELELFEGAMSGMRTPLDKNSIYIKADRRQQFEDDLNQEFVGIGILQAIDPNSKQLLVLSPLPDGPAAAAGVRAGDRIVRIEGQSTEGLALKEVSQRIKGKAGTSVTITVQHLADQHISENKPGASQTVDMTIVRRVVHEDTVEGATRGADGRWNFLLPGHPRIGYVAITAFADADGGAKSTEVDFRLALEQLQKEKIRGLVLDLRDDRGGSLWKAIAICRMLVSKGEIVTTRGRDHQVMDAYLATGNALSPDLPIAVLINGGSASASEIVAACLQDNGRAVVVGQRSYGKGTVQEVFDLGPPLGMLKLTVATYWRPSGQDINRPKEDGKNLPWGVTPNEGFEVPVTDEERERLLLGQRDREIAALTGAKPPPEVVDRVLQKASEYLDAKVK